MRGNDCILPKRNTSSIIDRVGVRFYMSLLSRMSNRNLARILFELFGQKLTFQMKIHYFTGR